MNIVTDYSTCRQHRSKYKCFSAPAANITSSPRSFPERSTLIKKQHILPRHAGVRDNAVVRATKKLPDDPKTVWAIEGSTGDQEQKDNIKNLTSELKISEPQDTEQLLAQIITPVQADLDLLTTNLTNTVGKGHPLLMAAALQIFGGKGKRLRPAIVLLVGRATSELLNRSEPALLEGHMRVAEITEIIHTASLVHDDVIDESDTRRGRKTINSLYGTRVAVLVGDYLFAQSSWLLACLGNIEVIRLVSQVIANFAQGEVSQATRLFDCSLSLEQYLEKSFCKTASLIAAGCRAAAAIADCPEPVKAAMFEYGRSLGLAFQIVDDILDFTETAQQLGKPRGQDLASGNLTAPALYALWSTAGGGELKRLIESRLEAPNSLESALHLVDAAGGVPAARRLAAEQAARARECLQVFPADSPSRRSLELAVDYVLARTR